MSNATELPPALPASDADQARLHGDDAVQGCDWCGRTVPREAAFDRRGGDGVEVVPLCAECEFGID